RDAHARRRAAARPAGAAPGGGGGRRRRRRRAALQPPPAPGRRLQRRHLRRLRGRHRAARARARRRLRLDHRAAGGLLGGVGAVRQPVRERRGERHRRRLAHPRPRRRGRRPAGVADAGVLTRRGRYLIGGTLPLLAAGLVSLVLQLLLYLLLDVLPDVLARGAPVSLGARYLLFSLPTGVGPGLPLSLLFASLLTLTRLGQDGEIQAALLAGVGPSRFVLPYLALGLAVSAFAPLINELLVPWGERRA